MLVFRRRDFDFEPFRHRQHPAPKFIVVHREGTFYRTIPKGLDGADWVAVARHSEP